MGLEMNWSDTEMRQRLYKLHDFIVSYDEWHLHIEQWEKSLSLSLSADLSSIGMIFAFLLHFLFDLQTIFFQVLLKRFVSCLS